MRPLRPLRLFICLVVLSYVSLVIFIASLLPVDYQTRRCGFVRKCRFWCPRPIGNVDGDLQLCQPIYNFSGDAKAAFILADRISLSVNDRMLLGEYIERAANCERFRSDLGYFTATEDVTDDERQFPIAFTILTFENLEQTERLLRLIYRPHNFYCIHIDAKSRKYLREGMEAIASCLENVFVATTTVKVMWGKVSIVEAEIVCMKQLLERYAEWKYLINLVGRDFPLRTNYELVKILQAYDGANDVDGTRNPQKHYFPSWFEYAWPGHNQPGARKDPPPHGFNIAKGSTHMAVTREFVEFAAHDQRAKDLLYWMRDIKVPDEHFFPTLNHNPQLNIPGSFIGDPDTKQSFARVKHWDFRDNFTDRRCVSGNFLNWICNIGIGDVSWVITSPHMFVNKIRLEREATAFRCLEVWYRDRVRRQGRRTPHAAVYDSTTFTFKVSLYANQAFVHNHVRLPVTPSRKA